MGKELQATIEFLRCVAGALTHPSFGTIDGRAIISEMMAVCANLLDDFGDHSEEINEIAAFVKDIIRTKEEPSDEDWELLKEKYDAAHQRLQQK